MFNAPFDLSRLALAWSEARSRRYDGGFSLTVFSYQREGRLVEHSYRPRIMVRPFDSRRARLGLGGTRLGSGEGVELRA